MHYKYADMRTTRLRRDQLAQPGDATSLFSPLNMRAGTIKINFTRTPQIHTDPNVADNSSVLHITAHPC